MSGENTHMPDAIEKKEIDLEDLQQDKEKQKGRLAKYSGIIALAVIILVFVILAVSGISIGQWFADLAMGYYNSLGEWGIYLGIFVLCLIGNATVIFPVPYTVVIIVLSAIVGPFQPWYFPLVIGIFAGAGASVGETTAWFVGRGAREWARFKESEKVARMKRWVDKGLAPLMIFIFSATPLADDPFLMVLGFVGYALPRALMWCFLGKWTMCFVVSGLTIWAADTSWGRWLINLFGIDIVSARTGQVPENTNPVTETIVWSLTIGLIIALIYVDWDKVIAKIGKKKPTFYPPPETSTTEVTVQKNVATESQVPKDPKNPTS